MMPVGNLQREAEELRACDYWNCDKVLIAEDERIAEVLSIISREMTGNDNSEDQDITTEEITGYVGYDLPELSPQIDSKKLAIIVSVLAVIFKANVKISSIRKVNT